MLNQGGHEWLTEFEKDGGRKNTYKKYYEQLSTSGFIFFIFIFHRHQHFSNTGD